MNAATSERWQDGVKPDAGGAVAAAEAAATWRLDLAYEGTAYRGLGQAARPADGAGAARGRAGDRAARAACASASRGARTPACTPGRRWRRSPAPATGPRAGAPAPLAQLAAAAGHRRAQGGAGAARLRGARGRRPQLPLRPVGDGGEARARARLRVGACAARWTGRRCARPRSCCPAAATSPPSRPPRTSTTLRARGDRRGLDRRRPGARRRGPALALRDQRRQLPPQHGARRPWARWSTSRRGA